MMKDHAGCFKGFSQLSRACYGEAIMQLKPNASEEFMIGFYHPGGGTTGEFAVRWEELAGRQVPRLEVWDDAWHALSEMPELIAMLAELPEGKIKPDEFCERLIALGYKDLTRDEQAAHREGE